MSYPKAVVDWAEAQLQKRRNAAKNELNARREEVYAAIPRLEEVEGLLSRTALSVSRLILSGGAEISSAVERIRAQNQSLQGERLRLLREAGLPGDYLDMPFACKKCEDMGYVHGERCDCMRQLLSAGMANQLNRQSGLSLCRFSNFDLSYYADRPDDKLGIVPRRHMEQIFRSCRNYAEDFSPDSPSLFLFGRTGLGKTHLSLSIASEVIERGYGVAYGSVQNFLSAIEAEKFGDRGDGQPTLASLCECDLLILDDLGSEFVTQFTVAALYQIINTRLMRGRPTIINSNLGPKEMTARYNERIVSRISGSYLSFQLVGSDIRQQKANLTRRGE